MPVPAGPVLRKAVPVVPITVDGIAPTAGSDGDPLNNHAIANDGQTVVEIHNADGGNAHTAYVRLRPVAGNEVTPRPYPIPAGQSRQIKLGHPYWYGKRVKVDVDSSQLKLAAYTLLNSRTA